MSFCFCFLQLFDEYAPLVNRSLFGRDSLFGIMVHLMSTNDEASTEDDRSVFLFRFPRFSTAGNDHECALILGYGWKCESNDVRKGVTHLEYTNKHWPSNHRD